MSLISVGLTGGFLTCSMLTPGWYTAFEKFADRFEGQGRGGGTEGFA